MWTGAKPSIQSIRKCLISTTWGNCSRSNGNSRPPNRWGFDTVLAQQDGRTTEPRYLQLIDTKGLRLDKGISVKSQPTPNRPAGSPTIGLELNEDAIILGILEFSNLLLGSMQSRW